MDQETNFTEEKAVKVAEIYLRTVYFSVEKIKKISQKLGLNTNLTSLYTETFLPEVIFA